MSAGQRAPQSFHAARHHELRGLKGPSQQSELRARAPLVDHRGKAQEQPGMHQLQVIMLSSATE